MNLKKVNFFDEYSSFYKTGQTGTKPKMLNARFLALIENNKEIIENATILDLANHDGRWSLAALKNGAKKVYGIEGKKELVQKGLENMKKYGIPEDKYNFVVGDIFEEIKKIPSREIDVVFCFGIFYHVSNHMELLKEIKKLQPKYLILDTEINKSKSPIVRFRKEPYYTPDSTISFEKFIAGRPSQSALNMMLDALDFKITYYNWKKNIQDWNGLEIYSSENSILLKRCIMYGLSLMRDKKEKEKRRNDLVRYCTTKRITLVAENQSVSK
tara:strand:- start:1717 stop:2529 length:813 start_codon:yes stop_codon:yes gene_type:complete